MIKNALLFDSKNVTGAYEDGQKLRIIGGKSYAVSVEATAPVPLTKVHEARFSWSLFTANAVNPYFSQPYEDSDLDTRHLYLKLSDREIVHRPNHSLAHGLRRSYLAVIIALMLKHAKEDILSPKAKELCLWIKKQFKNDPKFLQKVQFTSAFQRTGRQSELSQEKDRTIYEGYLTADQKNFKAKIREFQLGDGKLFEEAEISIYQEALIKKFDEKKDGVDPDCCPDIGFLSRLLYSAHLLDLRRLPSFSKEIIFKNISEQLFGTETPNSTEKKMRLKLWDFSGAYLRATGDRDMEDPSRQDWDKTVFYAQAQNPQLLVEALELATTKPEENFLRYLLVHAEIMQELKRVTKKYESEGKASKSQTEHQKKVENFRKNLKAAPYTASEGYLKTILSERGKNYIEIPKDRSEEIARQITHKNVLSFLSKEQQADEEFVNILVEAIMEERKHPDQVVLYHTTDGELGAFSHIYSKVRNQIAMKGGKILRAIDMAFIMLNESLKLKANAVDFAERFKSIRDTDPIYQMMGLSTNFTLFGCDELNASNTSSMFYNVEDDKVTLNPPQHYDKFIAYIEQKTGIFGIYPLFKEILDKFLKTQHMPPKRNRNLIQIFVDPKVLEEVTYLSVILGHQVTKEGKAQSLQEIIQLLRNCPEKVQEHLLGTTAIEKSAPLIYLRHLQARFFMNPNVMLDDAGLINIKSYWRLPLENSKAYESKISSGVNECLLSWLKNGCPFDSDAFLPETVRLPHFMEMVYHGSTTSQPPKASLTLEQRFVQLLISKKSEHAATLLEESYEELKSKNFIVLADEHSLIKGEFDLPTLIANCNPSVAVLEIAFKKNIFKGGENVCKVLSKLESQDPDTLKALLDTFNACSDPSKTAHLFLKYFDVHEVTNSKFRIKESLEAINHIQNNESYLEAFLPFFQSCKYECVQIFCEHFTKISPDYKDLNLLKDALKVFAFHDDIVEQAKFCRNINNILCTVDSYRKKLSHQDCEYIFSAASKMSDPSEPSKVGSASLRDKFKFMDIFSKINWIPAKQKHSLILASSNGQNVLSYAKTCIHLFNFTFLKSATGLALINTVIEKLNAGETPSNEAFLEYDWYSTDPDYSNRLIALYVSSCCKL